MDWFIKTFLVSFDECKQKKITQKQAGVFRKYFDLLVQDGRAKLEYEGMSAKNVFIEVFIFDGYKYTLYEEKTNQKSYSRSKKHFLDVEQLEEEEEYYS